MQIALVIGSTISTIKDESIRGRKLLIVRKADTAGNMTGEPFVAVDTVSAGAGDLVLITDGADTYSRADLNDAIDIAQRTETTIFAISTKAGLSGTVVGVETGQVKSKADKDLERLCDETGGAAFFTGDMLTLERSFSKISKELRSQYLITYKPTNDKYDGSYRRVEVKLTGSQNNMKLRTKRGYKAIADSVRAGS